MYNKCQNLSKHSNGFCVYGCTYKLKNQVLLTKAG